jgi:DNA-binding IclR family transcriptional regulator
MQAIERAFAALRAVRATEGSAGVSEIARATGLPKSTVSRLLTALEEVGAVQRIDPTGGYVIGPGLVTLTNEGTGFGSLRDVARPYLRELTDRLGESSGLTVADGDSALYVDHVSSDGSVRTRDWTGTRFPFHTLAGGLALLMTWSDRSVDRFADLGLESFSTETVTTRRDLETKLTNARRDGYVWTMGDFDLEINGVAAPVRNEQGYAIGAISVYGPSYRFPGDRDVDDIGESVKETSLHVQNQTHR